MKVADESDLGYETARRLQVGDTVLVPSTDYRDIRKAAFQEYAIATHYNAARIPPNVPVHVSAALGVAFVASVLALGVSLGLDFSVNERTPGPNFVQILQSIGENSSIPEDIRGECFTGKEEKERLKKGDWLAIWGGMYLDSSMPVSLPSTTTFHLLRGMLTMITASTTTGYITIQLAKLAGLKVICVADVARYGSKLYHAGADVLVDRRDPERAVEIIRGVTDGKLRYALDIVGRETATLLQGALHDATPAATTTTTAAAAVATTTTATTTTTTTDNEAKETNAEAQSQPSQPTDETALGKSHLLGLTGLPKVQDQKAGFVYHTVPIKLFHLSPPIGEGLVTWLEDLLSSGTLKLQETVHMDGGLEGINAALDTLRDGSVSGKRIVVSI